MAKETQTAVAEAPETSETPEERPAEESRRADSAAEGSAPADSAAEDSAAEDSATADRLPQKRPAAEGDEAEPAEPGPGADLDDAELRRVLCALLFASPEPLSEARLAQLAEGPPPARVRAALAELGAELERAELPLELRKLAGGWRLLTATALAPVVARLFQSRKSERLSPAGLETLAIVAYRQPVTKAEIEAIRGVQCGPMLRTLVDRGLVKVTGRAEVPGSPLEYGTTREFLDRFGLGGLDDLPRDGELLG